MQTINYPAIYELQKLAKRERAREVACLIAKAVLWMRSRLPGADPALRDLECCAPA